VREVARWATTDVQGTLARIYAEVAALRPTAETIIGVSCGGPLDATRGVILSPPNLPGWDNIAICAELTARFGGRAFLMNDANACAVAEWQFGRRPWVPEYGFSHDGHGHGLRADSRWAAL